MAKTPAKQVEFTNAAECTQTVGGIDSGSTFDNVSLETLINQMLYPELFPALVNPSSTFVLDLDGYHEIDETVASLNFTCTFNRGTIIPAYGTSGYRSGLPNNYNYTGDTLPADEPSVSLTDDQEVTDYDVVSGAQSWTASVDYDEGEQPLSSLSNNYDSPLSAGTTSADTVTITGVYPWYGSNTTIGTLTKQSLTSMSATYYQFTAVAEAGSDKQEADFPQAFDAITGIRFYNTVSSAWEWINGSAANSLLTFTKTADTQTIQGNVIDYWLYTHNGAQIGERQLRFYT